MAKRDIDRGKFKGRLLQKLILNGQICSIINEKKRKEESLKEHKKGPKLTFWSDEFLENENLSYKETVDKFLELYPIYNNDEGKELLKDWTIEWYEKIKQQKGKESAKELFNKKKNVYKNKDEQSHNDEER